MQKKDFDEGFNMVADGERYGAVELVSSPNPPFQISFSTSPEGQRGNPGWVTLTNSS